MEHLKEVDLILLVSCIGGATAGARPESADAASGDQWLGEAPW